MKLKLLFIILIFLNPTIIYGQTGKPVGWEYSSKKVSSNIYKVIITAKIKDSWHIYAQNSPQEFSLPTMINFNRNPLLELQGDCKEVGRLEELTLDEATVKYYSNKVSFVQMVKTRSNAKTRIKGTIQFMACTKTRCLPPDTEGFSIVLN